MKTRHLIWAALAFPAIFAACSNDDFTTDTNSPIANGKVVDGIKFTITKGGGADTRLNKDGWEDGDIVGLAFAKSGDENVYTNHALKYNKAGNFFASSSLIYEGPHFAYFPFDETHLSIKPLAVSLATEQEVGKENDLIWKDGFSISAMDELTVKNGSGYGKNAEFELERLTNTLQLKVKAGNVGDITPADIKLKSVTVATSGTAPFVQNLDVATSELPEAVHDAYDALDPADKLDAAKVAVAKATDKAATKALIIKDGVIDAEVYAASGKALNYTTAEQTITTTIKGNAPINAAYPVNFLMFPTVDNSSTAAQITITIVTNYGEVSITKATSTPLGETADAKAIRLANNAEIDKLAALLGAAGHSVGNKSYKLSEVNAAPLALSFTADMAQSELDEISIANDAEMADAIKIATSVTTVATFNITDNVTADLSTIPANVTTIDVASTKTLKVSGAVNHDIEFTGTGFTEVAAGTTLTIDGTIPSPRKVTMTNLVNWGNVEIGSNGTLELSGTANINHSVITNKGTLKLASSAALTNDKAEATEGHPACTGILDNYKTIIGTSAEMVNKGKLHQRGTITSVTFKSTLGGSAAAVVGSIAISYNGATLPANCGATMQAQATTPEEIAKALSTGATTIIVDGVVSVTGNLAATAATTFVLEKETQFYVLAGTSATQNVNIKVTGTNVIFAITDPSIYLAIENLEIAKDAKLTIGNSTDKYAKKTAINVNDLKYVAGSTVINNGWVYAKAVSENNGSWGGMSVNMKETSSTNSDLVVIGGALSTR